MCGREERAAVSRMAEEKSGQNKNRDARTAQDLRIREQAQGGGP